jgi:hypothetical protein
LDISSWLILDLSLRAGTAQGPGYLQKDENSQEQVNQSSHLPNAPFLKLPAQRAGLPGKEVLL